MKSKIVDKTDVPALIDKLIERYRVFAPVDAEKYTRLMEIASGDEASLDLQSLKLSSKEILLPQTEILLRIRKGEAGLEAEEPSEDDKDWVLFGVRPCDARGLVLTDEFLASGEHKHKPYMDKRRKTSVVGLACNHPRATCFCMSVRGSPFGKEGLDVLLVDLPPGAGRARQYAEFLGPETAFVLVTIPTDLARGVVENEFLKVLVNIF